MERCINGFGSHVLTKMSVLEPASFSDEEAITFVYSIEGDTDEFRKVISQSKLNAIYSKLRGRFSANESMELKGMGINYDMEYFVDEKRDIIIACYREDVGNYDLITFMGEREKVSELVNMLEGRNVLQAA